MLSVFIGKGAGKGSHKLDLDRKCYFLSLKYNNFFKTKNDVLKHYTECNTDEFVIIEFVINEDQLFILLNNEELFDVSFANKWFYLKDDDNSYKDVTHLIAFL